MSVDIETLGLDVDNALQRFAAATDAIRSENNRLHAAILDAIRVLDSLPATTETPTTLLADRLATTLMERNHHAF